MPLVIYGLGVDTHTHTHTHILSWNKSDDFKKPGMPGLKGKETRHKFNSGTSKH